MRKWLLCILMILIATVGYSQAAAGFTKIGTSTTTSYTDSTCPLLSSCLYQVTSVDSSGVESQPAACAATALCIGGNQVVAVMPSSGTHTVAVSWTAPTTTGVTYNVYRHIGPLPPTALNVVVN